MEIIKTDDFVKNLNRLSHAAQRLYDTQEKRFLDNRRDPRLHIKPIDTLPGSFVFRVTRRYRVFFYFQNRETAIFFDIDHRKDAYR